MSLWRQYWGRFGNDGISEAESDAEMVVSSANPGCGRSKNGILFYDGTIYVTTGQTGKL